MLIERLVIKESFPTEKVIRDIKFNTKGLNLIVDEGNRKRGNGVGKTTFLRLIDIAFGARERKALYIDPETSSVNETLKSYIENSKVYIEMTLINEITNVKTTLIVELFPKGERAIDGELYNYDNYRSKLNEIVFHNTDEVPTLRSLIGKFIRVNMNGDDNSFLKFNDEHSTTAEYQNIYNYLFKFKDTEIEKLILKLHESIRNLENQFKMVKRSLKYDGLNQIDAKIDIIASKVKELESKQATYINEKIILDEAKIMENRKEYSLLNRECEKLLFDIKILEENIENESSNNEQIDRQSLKEFYDDVTFNLSELNKKFEELVAFNNELNKNQLNTYNKLLKAKKEKLSNVNKLKEEFNGDKYFYIYQHGMCPFKYILVPDNSEEYYEYIKSNKEFLKHKEESSKEELGYDLFRIIKPVTKCSITFKNSIGFSQIPNGFYPQFSNNYGLIDNQGLAIKP